jgi:hypothetical protein
MRIPAAAVLVMLAAAPGFAMQKGDAQRDKDRQVALDHYQKGRDAMAGERLEDAVAEFKPPPASIRSSASRISGRARRTWP